MFFDGGGVRCGYAHRVLVLISTHVMNKKEAQAVAVAFCSSVFPRSRSASVFRCLVLGCCFLPVLLLMDCCLLVGGGLLLGLGAATTSSC